MKIENKNKKKPSFINMWKFPFYLFLTLMLIFFGMFFIFISQKLVDSAVVLLILSLLFVILTEIFWDLKETEETIFAAKKNLQEFKDKNYGIDNERKQ